MIQYLYLEHFEKTILGGNIMTGKELKRMSRKDLIEIILVQQKENEELSDQLMKASNKLKDRKIVLDKAGSIAEASLQMSGIFEAAEVAAKKYLDNIEILAGRQEEVCKKMEAEAQKKADQIIVDAETYSKKVHEEADTYWKTVREKAEVLFEEHETLRKFIAAARTEDQA